MDGDRIHRARSRDGTEIVGRVHGQGDPVVLVHGGLEDGDLCWESLLPMLRERFTCYLMSRRGRGLSSEHPDVSPERLLEDVTAFVASIDEPVKLVGESDGGPLALGAAARTGAVSAVAVYEPVVTEVLDEKLGARLEDTFTQVRQAARQGRVTDAARIFCGLVANDDEFAALSASDYFQACGRYMPTMLAEFEQGDRSEGPGPTDPSVLEGITAPVLAMRGSETALGAFFTAGVQHVAEHAKDVRVAAIAGAGHWGPVLQPEPIADELLRFFGPRSG